MPKLQIKRAQDDFSNFADSKISARHTILRHITQAVTNQTGTGRHRTAVSSEMPCVHFSVQNDTGSRLAVHRAAT